MPQPPSVTYAVPGLVGCTARSVGKRSGRPVVMLVHSEPPSWVTKTPGGAGASMGIRRNGAVPTYTTPASVRETAIESGGLPSSGRPPLLSNHESPPLVLL